MDTGDSRNQNRGEPLEQLRTRFASLQDPRVERTKLHQLLDIITIAICAVICGADDWSEIELFGHAKEAFFRSFLPLPNGIPSHDTFNRVFARLNPQQFQQCFLEWVQDLVRTTSGQVKGVVAIDGKRVCGSRDTYSGKGPIQMVSAWARDNGMVLGQVKVDDKSNEITAIPTLLQLLDLEGCIVTIDAMGCQKEIAEAIVEGGGDYVLALKGNHSVLHQDVITTFSEGLDTHFKGIRHHAHETVEKGHGRIERRRYYLVDDPLYMRYLDQQEKWPGLCSVGMVEAEREVDGVVSKERRYYLCSIVAALQSESSRRQREDTWGTAHGALKTACTGCWMWHSVRTTIVPAPTTHPTTSPSCDTWLSTYSKPRRASR